MHDQRDLLVIRADASCQIGTGHVMRCLALAQAWQESGGECRFVSHDLPAGLQERLVAEGLSWTPLLAQPGSAADAQQTADALNPGGGSWTVADGYQFGETWQQTFRSRGRRLLLIDDYAHLAEYDADIVLNQNLGATRSAYRLATSTTSLLLGNQFALLRREFRRARDRRGPRPTHTKAGRRILVTLGGSDPHDVTTRVLASLAQVERAEMEVSAVVGSANPRLAQLQQLAEGLPYRLELAVNPPNLPELMSSADLAISAAGSTTWELAFLGIPICHIVTADNQREIAKHSAWRGYAVNLGDRRRMKDEELVRAVTNLLGNPEQRQSMARSGQTMVDGQGARRVVEFVRILSGTPGCVSLAS